MGVNLETKIFNGWIDPSKEIPNETEDFPKITFGKNRWSDADVPVTIILVYPSASTSQENHEE